MEGWLVGWLWMDGYMKVRMTVSMTMWMAVCKHGWLAEWMKVRMAGTMA